MTQPQRTPPDTPAATPPTAPALKLGTLLDRLSGRSGGRVPRATDAGLPQHKYVVPRQSLRFFPDAGPGGHPSAWSFPAYLDQPGVPWLARLKALYAMGVSFPSSISPEGGMLLHALVRNARPRTVAEVGVSLGVSTIWIAAALAEIDAAEGVDPADPARRVVHAFDDFGPIRKGPWRDEELTEDRRTFVERSLRDAGLSDRVVLHAGLSWDTIPRAVPELRARGGVQLAFLDGDHSVEGVRRDLLAIEPVLQTGAVVIVHDIYPERCGGHEGGRHLLDHASDECAGLYETSELYLAPVNYGLGILRRIG